MSTLKVEVVPIKLEKHPNADVLSLVYIKGWQVAVRTDEFKDAKLGAYLPVDSVVPQTDEWESLRQHKYRVRTIRLRKLISQGMLIPAREGWVEGQDVTEELKIQKYEPPEPVFLSGDTAKDISDFPTYTNIERWKNYPDVFRPGDPVHITEKIHGTNFRCGIINDEFCVGSHERCRKPGGENIYSSIAREFKLEEKLRESQKILGCEDIVYFGEIFGKSIQDLRYDLQKPSVRCFDIWISRLIDRHKIDVFSAGYLDPKSAFELCSKLGVEFVPTLFIGDFKPELLELAEGQSAIAEHIKEGIVIKSLKPNDFHPEIGRKVLKRLSEAYELRKGERKKRKKHGIKKPTEYH